MPEACPEALTADDVARILRCDRRAVYRLAREGKLPAARVGRLLRFSAETVERFLAGELAAAEAGGARDAE